MPAMRLLKRSAVTVVGVALLVLGAAMMVLPGPGILVIVGGLALLATEYVWARRMLTTARAQAEKAQEAAVASPVRTTGTVVFGVGLLALGLAMVLLPDVDLPFWNPITGGVMAVTSLILLATTYLALRQARAEGTAYAPGGPEGDDSARTGSTRP